MKAALLLRRPATGQAARRRELGRELSRLSLLQELSLRLGHLQPLDPKRCFVGALAPHLTALQALRELFLGWLSEESMTAARLLLPGVKVDTLFCGQLCPSIPPRHRDTPTYSGWRT